MESPTPLAPTCSVAFGVVAIHTKAVRRKTSTHSAREKPSGDAARDTAHCHAMPTSTSAVMRAREPRRSTPRRLPKRARARDVLSNVGRITQLKRRSRAADTLPHTAR